MVIYIYVLTHTLSADLADPAQAARVWDEIHAVATLQGVVNRRQPRLYLRYVEHAGRNIDDYWLDKLTAPTAWLAGAERRTIDSLEDLVARFRDDLAGAVVYDARVAALSNVASAFAGAEDLVAIRYDETPGSVCDRLVRRGPKLPVQRRLTPETIAGMGSGSPKCDAYLWAKRELLDAGRCDPRHLGYYLDAYWIAHAPRSVPNHHTLTNHDYFVARRAFFCDLNCWGDEKPIDDPGQPLGADLGTLRAILHAMYDRGGGALIHVGGFTPWAFKYTDHDRAGGAHFGVDTEWELVRVLSAYNAWLDADAIGHGAMANASFFMHFPRRVGTAHPCSPAERWALPTLPTADYLMFYVGDYDSAAWLYQRVPDLWDDPRRGEAPLNWAISPALARRAPMAMAYLWTTRTPNDHFIAADNGAGYLNPSMLAAPRPVSGLPDGLAAWVEHNRRAYRQWDLTVTGFIIDGLAPPTSGRALEAYAQFSPDGVVCQRLDVPARLVGTLPVLRAGPDVNDDDPAAAAARILAAVEKGRAEGQRFHWVRGVLKSPTWYANVTMELSRQDPRIAIVGAPEFFARLRGSLRRAQ